MTEISGLDHNLKLRTLEISNNQIKHLTNLNHLQNLEELWASSNLLLSFDEVDRELRDKEKLTTVYFEANPMQFENPALYRNKVRLALPQIQQVDASMLRSSYKITLNLLSTDLGSFCTSFMKTLQVEILRSLGGRITLGSRKRSP